VTDQAPPRRQDATRQPNAAAEANPTGQPDTTAQRETLLREHAVQRRQRDAAPLGSEPYRAAAIRIGEIEVEIARLERAAGLG
jgi:hypothetical protein